MSKLINENQFAEKIYRETKNVVKAISKLRTVTKYAKWDLQNRCAISRNSSAMLENITDLEKDLAKFAEDINKQSKLMLKHIQHDYSMFENEQGVAEQCKEDNKVVEAILRSFGIFTPTETEEETIDIFNN